MTTTQAKRTRTVRLLLMGLLIATATVSGTLRTPGFTPAGALPRYPLPLDGPEAWLDNAKMRIAADGALEFDYGRAHGGAGWSFNPVTTAQFCVAAYNRWADHPRDTHARRWMIDAARALVRRAEPTPTGIVWRYPFPQTGFGARPGWISGMAQGQSMACLAGAAASTSRDPAFDRAVAGAFRALVAPYGRNGTAVRMPKGTFYEEVADPAVTPTHILNGMIYALAGIWLANTLSPDPEYQTAFDEGVDAVRSVISTYHAAGSSLYDLGRRALALPGKYNIVHVAQSAWLGRLTGDPLFTQEALRFASHERRIRFTARVLKGRGSDPRVVRLDGTAGVLRTRAGDGRLRLRLTLAEARKIDRVEIATYVGVSAPASIVVEAGGVRTTVRGTRFATVRVPAREVRSVTVDLRAAPREGLSIQLVTLSDRAIRSLVPLSSELDPYRPGGHSTPLAAVDGDETTQWRPVKRHRPTLLLSLGDAGHRTLRVDTCGRTGPIALAFSEDLRTMTRASRLHAGALLVVPPGARYLRLDWPEGAACVSEIVGAS